MTKIYIDAGHGGKDTGAVGNGLYEKHIALAITKKVENQLKQYKNVEVMLSRTFDTFLSLEERTNKANHWGADVYIAIHINASKGASNKGFESFTHPQTDSKTKGFQNVMHEEIIKQMPGVVDRGKKAENFHVLRESFMAAILTENLFISNLSDSKLLNDDYFLDKIATGHTNGLVKFFGLVKKERSPIDTNQNKLFQVISGTFKERKNAENLVNKLKSLGYDSYIKEK